MCIFIHSTAHLLEKKASLHGAHAGDISVLRMAHHCVWSKTKDNLLQISLDPDSQVTSSLSGEMETESPLLWIIALRCYHSLIFSLCYLTLVNSAYRGPPLYYWWEMQNCNNDSPNSHFKFSEQLHSLEPVTESQQMFREAPLHQNQQ